MTTTTQPTGPLRPEGPAKLTGHAQYAADVPAPGALAAALVGASVPTGRVAALHTAAAEKAPGVAAVLTAADLPRLRPQSSPPLGHAALPMQDDAVRYEGDPIAIVLAATWEQAVHAANLVTAEYADVTEPLMFGQAEPVPPDSGHVLWPTDHRTGDVEAGLAAAETVVSARYTTSDRHHNPIEPSSTLAEWDGDRLTVHSSVQTLTLTQQTLAGLFGLDPEQVRVVCPYVGGGFGCKGYVWPNTTLAAAAAKAVGRPVRLTSTRAQMFTLNGHQPATRQEITLGATANGRLTAVRHHAVNATARGEGHFCEGAPVAAGWLYASPAIQTRIRVQQVDRPNPTAMRSPAEGLGLFALESAMDELACASGIDPVELRLCNEPEVDPTTGKPFSSRTLADCLREGARRFGWERRTPEPGSMRDGNDLVGWGVAAVTRETNRAASTVRMRAHADGRFVVETGIQEIGTGTPAVIQAVAGEVLGIAPARVGIEHGDTAQPPGSPAIGSMSAMSLGSAVHIAATELGDKLTAAGGAAGLRTAGIDYLEVEGRWDPDEDAARWKDHSVNAYGAVFAEVRVDPDLGLVRMGRCTAVYGAGRVLSPLTARSQAIGGIVWGWGQAVLEKSVLEPGRGRFLSKNLAGYIVPVNADIGDIDITFLDDDRHASPIGAKGIGELSAIGVGAAITNAVHHATGRRIRDLPIRIHDLL
ncbi:xanthine dehydrogenase family protein molybdopterin-binding subunit [Saccharopolyspora taberi]|uniref:Xanthine dehydrogenase family protein molybdopterin-binding subunit n=1 Tax=Saccharopolyspora taberi TaxID=60895 RepID=A0ABN3VKL5_9PSEU